MPSNPEEILNIARDSIRKYAGDDPDKWFYANRFVFARLQLDERKTKTNVKQKLFEKQKFCPHCNDVFKSEKGIHLHRVDENRGYSIENCVLMHRTCHQEYHRQHPRHGHSNQSASTTLIKTSKKYENNSFYYWWDIPPSVIESTEYDNIEFIKADSNESCIVSIYDIKHFLVPERQTSRRNRPWGVQVRRNNISSLAFDPGRSGGDWLYFSVNWQIRND